MKSGALVICLFVLALAGLIFVIDYTYTRSAASFALLLNELPPGTHFEEFTKRFGEPSRHFSDAEIMKEWGPLSDPELLNSSELFYFFNRSSIPYRFVCVYRNKTTGRVERVTWKAM